ncbi:DUF6950 family protein [Methylobacterium sp. JK268]
MEPGQDLTAFVRRMAAEPFAWGATDCGCMMGLWCVARAGIDPAAPLRGRYSTARGARRAIARLGGFVAAGRTLMGAAGFAETGAPRAGDAGLVEHPIVGPAFAVHVGIGWAVKSERGLALGDWPVLVAWAVA